MKTHINKQIFMAFAGDLRLWAVFLCKMCFSLLLEFLINFLFFYQDHFKLRKEEIVIK